MLSLHFPWRTKPWVGHLCEQWSNNGDTKLLLCSMSNLISLGRWPLATSPLFFDGLKMVLIGRNVPFKINQWSCSSFLFLFFFVALWKGKLKAFPYDLKVYLCICMWVLLNSLWAQAQLLPFFVRSYDCRWLHYGLFSSLHPFFIVNE